MFEGLWPGGGETVYWAKGESQESNAWEHPALSGFGIRVCFGIYKYVLTQVLSVCPLLAFQIQQTESFPQGVHVAWTPGSVCTLTVHHQQAQVQFFGWSVRTLFTFWTTVTYDPKTITVSDVTNAHVHTLAFALLSPSRSYNSSVVLLAVKADLSWSCWLWPSQSE